MAFKLKKSETVEESIRRICTEQIEKAIGEIDESDLDRHETVHQVRKRCKKLRGVLRMARGGLGDTYKRENAHYRDLAKAMSGMRDAEALIECLDDLEDTFSDQIADGAFDSVRAELERRKTKKAEDAGDITVLLAEARDGLEAGLVRVPDWHFSKDGFANLKKGLKKTYSRARDGMADALDSDDAEDFHEWRKRAKYHRFHMKVLRPIWQDNVEERRDSAEDISDLLGDDHDIHVLRHTLQAEPDAFGDARALQALFGLMDRRQAELREKARREGERLFTDKPKVLLARLEDYHDAWRIGARRPEPALMEP